MTLSSERDSSQKPTFIVASIALSLQIISNLSASMFVFFNYLFIYFRLCWVSIDVWAFALVVVSRGYLQL